MRLFVSPLASLGSLVSLVSLVSLAGCEIGSEAAFVGKAQLSTCDDEIPVCNTTAGCKLVEEDRYIEGQFPGSRFFIVPSEGEAVIRVKIYWRSEVGPGFDTRIIWHEPACVDSYTFESQGADVFADSNSQGIFVKEQRVFRGGDHLIELRSDAVADFLLRTETLTADEYDAEQRDINNGVF